jgi:secreted trypsin-like serine protease
MASNHNTLQVPKSKFYVSSDTSNSTSNLELPSLSPQILSADTFRPNSSRSLPTTTTTTTTTITLPIQSARRKNMREIIGTTTTDEFEALPLAVRRKVRT